MSIYLEWPQILNKDYLHVDPWIWNLLILLAPWSVNLYYMKLGTKAAIIKWIMNTDDITLFVATEMSFKLLLIAKLGTATEDFPTQ